MPSAEAGHLPATLYMPSGPLCHPTMMAPEHHSQGEVIVPVQPMGEQQIHIYVMFEFLCICVYVHGNAKVNARGVFHTFLHLLCDEGEGDVTQRRSQSDISCLDLCQGC